MSQLLRIGRNMQGIYTHLTRALVYGAQGYSNVIQYSHIVTTSAFNDFGDLTLARAGGVGFSSATRGISAAGTNGSSSNVIDYFTIATLGNATDFGDTAVKSTWSRGCSSATRGIIRLNNSAIYYITIATAGNTASFGYFVSAYMGGALSSPTRGVMDGGAAAVGNLGYITIATTGNSTFFGTSMAQYYTATGGSSGTRGLIAGGSSGGYTNVISYITIASTGNIADFGDLTTAKEYGATPHSKLKWLYAGGYTSGSAVIQNCDTVMFATLGNASNFGNLLSATHNHSGACSDSHGGLA